MISRRLQSEGRSAWIGVLNEEGLGALRRNGHDVVAGACAPDLLPADVRFVDAALQQALESASSAELVALYVAPFPGRPLVSGKPLGASPAVTIALSIQPDLRCLRGHFPALPVVPAATQVGWALELGAEYLGTPPTMRAMRSVKFERIIQPGRLLRLHLAAEIGASMLRFEYVSATGRHSAGRIETGVADA